MLAELQLNYGWLANNRPLKSGHQKIFLAMTSDFDTINDKFHTKACIVWIPNSFTMPRI